MGKRSIEGFSDIGHTVNTHSKTLEHITVEKRGEIIKLMMSNIYTDKIPELISQTGLRSELPCSAWNYNDSLNIISMYLRMVQGANNLTAEALGTFLIKLVAKQESRWLRI